VETIEEGVMEEFVGYHNGEWLPISRIKPDPADRGVTLGDQVTDVERTFNGSSFRMKEHIDRLYKSLKYVRIDPGLSPEEMLEVSEEGIERNEHLRPEGNDFIIVHVVTRGPGGPRAWSAGPPNVYIKYKLMGYDFFAHQYTAGVRGAITRTRSYEPESLDPKVKHLSRLNMSLADLEANDIDPGAWPILTDMHGNLTEGSGYNVAIVTDGVIRTPTDHAILAGISRAMVMDLAKQLELPAYEEDLQPYDLYTADECFFTSTPFSVLPVTQVDRRSIGDGRPGPITQQLLAAWSEAVGLDIVDQALRFARE
jgi:branched-chain amino acid aminotransferase